MRWLLVVLLSTACSFDGVPPAGTDSGNRVDAAVADAAPNDADVSPNAFRRVFTIDPNALVAAEVANLPIPITLSSDPHFRDNANLTGADLLVRYGEQQLPLDIERLDVAAGDLIAWVVLPTVAPGTTATIDLYYGDGQVAPFDSTNPWQMVADAVWHFEEIGAVTTVQDHSPSNFDGTRNNNGSITITDGVYGDAFDFRDAVVFAPNADALNRDQNASFTISMWFNQQGTNNAFDFAFNKGGPRTNTAGYEFPLGSSTWRANLRDTDGDERLLVFGLEVNLAAGWHHLAMVVDRAANQIRLYLDGTEVDTALIDDLGDLGSSEIARVGGDNEPPDAFIDEFRSYPSAMSADFIAIDYAIGQSLSNVVTVAAPQDVRYPGT